MKVIALLALSALCLTVGCGPNYNGWITEREAVAKATGSNEIVLVPGSITNYLARTPNGDIYFATPTFVTNGPRGPEYNVQKTLMFANKTEVK